MFSFFTKKKYLVDYLNGFVDIHNHILPGIDDGAKTVEDSIGLIKGLGELGVSNFICTPHIMENYYPNTPLSIQKSLALLQNELKMQGMNHVKISAAAEHMIDSGFEKLIEEKTFMPLSKNYLLIEMSYLQASINFEPSIIKIQEAGYHPILAHPERYIYLHSKKKMYSHYKAMGIYFQLNMLSLSGYYGSMVQKATFKLLENDMFNFIGTDVHHQNHLKALKKITLKEKHVYKIESLITSTIAYL